jgi:hypothetical protein
MNVVNTYFLSLQYSVSVAVAEDSMLSNRLIIEVVCVNVCFIGETIG